MNQKGLSSLLLLFMIVLGIFLIWESNEFISHYTRQQNKESSAGESNKEPLCLTGESDNCNDSNDVFILD